MVIWDCFELVLIVPNFHGFSLVFWTGDVHTMSLVLLSSPNKSQFPWIVYLQRKFVKIVVRFYYYFNIMSFEPILLNFQLFRYSSVSLIRVPNEALGAGQMGFARCGASESGTGVHFHSNFVVRDLLPLGNRSHTPVTFHVTLFSRRRFLRCPPPSVGPAKSPARKNLRPRCSLFPLYLLYKSPSNFVLSWSTSSWAETGKLKLKSRPPVSFFFKHVFDANEHQLPCLILG